MDLISQLQRKITDYFQPKLVSPIPDINILSEGQAYGIANDQSREAAARKRNLEMANRPTPTPISFKYSEELANAPRKKNTSAKDNYIPEPTMKPVLNIGKMKVVPVSESVQRQYSGKEPITWDNFVNLLKEEGGKRGYDWQTLAKQKALESAFGTSQFARERNNFGGIGAYDRNPNSAFKFNSPMEYLDYYDKMIQKRFPNAYKVRNNPRKFIEELKKGGYATDPDYVEKVMNTPLKRDS